MSSRSTARAAGKRRDRSFSPGRHRKSPVQHKINPKIDLSQERWKHDRYLDAEGRSQSSSTNSNSDNGSLKRVSRLQHKHRSKMSRNYRDLGSIGDERANVSSRQSKHLDPSKSGYNISRDNNEGIFKQVRRRSRKGSTTRSIPRQGLDKSLENRHGMDVEDKKCLLQHSLSDNLGRGGAVNHQYSRRRREAAKDAAFEEESDAEQNCKQIEAMYLPSTDGLDQRKLRKKLLDGMNTIKSKISTRPGLRMDEDGKLYFLVKSGCPRNFKKAKELVIEVVQEVLKKLRLEAKHSLPSGSIISSSKVTKKSSRRSSDERTCSDISLSSSDEQHLRRSHSNRPEGVRRRSSGGRRCSHDRSLTRDGHGRNRSGDKISRDGSDMLPVKGEKFFRSCHDDRYYKEDCNKDSQRRFDGADQMHENDRNFIDRTHGPNKRDLHSRVGVFPRGINYQRRNKEQSGRSRYSQREESFEHRDGGPGNFGYTDEHGPHQSGGDWPASESDRPVTATTGVALVDAASAGRLAFVYNLDAGMKECNIRSAFCSRFGSLQTRGIEFVDFQPYQSDTLMGLAVVKFRTRYRSLEYAFMKSPTLEVNQTTVPVLVLQGLIDSTDTLLKNRFASILRKKTHSQRLPGVFPQGVQPERIVLVVDTMAPHLDLDKLNSLHLISKIICGVDMDAVGFYDLIREDDSFDYDNVLYVVIPWISFFLKHLCIMPNDGTCSDTASKTKMKNSLEALVLSLNVGKDFCYNPILQSNLDGSTDFFSCLETPHISTTGIEKAAEALSRRLIFTAHNLRCSVLSRTQNSEMVFCGFPVTSLTPSEAEQHIAFAVGEDQAVEISTAVLASMRVFNKFAASTWKLGGFQFSDLEWLQEIPEIPKVPHKGNSSVLKSDETKSQCDKNSAENAYMKKTSEMSNDPSDKLSSNSKETSLSLNKCGGFSLDQWPHLKWVESCSLSPSAKRNAFDDPTDFEKDSAVPAVKDPSFNCMGNKNLLPSNSVGNSSALKNETVTSHSNEQPVYSADNTDPTSKEAGNLGDIAPEHSETFDGRSSAGHAYTDHSVKESNKEEDSPKSMDDDPLEVDNTYLKIVEEFNQENVEGGSDFKAIKMKLASKDASIVEGTPGKPCNIRKMSPGKETKTQTRSVLDFDKLKEAYTYEIMRASLQITRTWKKKGSFLPWTPLDSEKFDSGTLPGIVVASVEHQIYKEQWNGQQRQTEYTCHKCDGCSGDLSWAERHCYERKHIDQLLTNSPELTPEVGQLLVTGGAKYDNTYGLTQEFLQKMVHARLLYIDESNKKDVVYECLVCKQSFNKVSLRVHLGSFQHRSCLNTHLGLANHESAVTLTENWPIIKRLFRHTSFDAVVLVADSSLRSTLLPLVRSNVHLYTVPDLVMSEDSQTEALKRWNLDSNQLLQDLVDPRVLWIVVAGLDLLLQPQLKSFFDSTFNRTVPEEAVVKVEEGTASPKERIALISADKQGAVKSSEAVDEKKASRKDLERSIQQVLDFIKLDPEVDAIESSEVSKALESGLEGAGVSVESHRLKSDAIAVKNELLREGYQLEEEAACSTGQADKLKTSKEFEDIDSGTDNEVASIEKTFKRPANDCCGSFSWDISSDPNFLWSLDKALNSLNDLRSFLQSRLDFGHTVLMMPVAPLHIVLDTVPTQTLRSLSCLHQTVVAHADQVLGLQRAYSTLFKKTYSLYRSISEQENVLFVEESAMQDASFSIVKNTRSDIQWLNISSWHAPLETLIVGAFMGLPCLYPKPTSVSYSELSLWPRSSACAIIGIPMVTPANDYTQNKLFHIPHRLTFSERDVKFIVNTLAARTNYDKSVTWTCYLVCPFPEILFTSGVLSLCAREGCSNPIIAWKAKKGQSLHRVLDRITSFISLLSYALGPGNFATVYPLFPTAVVAFDEVNPETHPILHTVAMKNINHQTHFVHESYRDVVSPIIKKFKKGLTDIFNKSKMCSPIEIDDGENFSFIKPSPLMRHCETLIKMSEIKEWLALVNSILQNNHSKMEVMSSQALTEAEQVPGIFNPFTWSDKSFPGQPVNPSSAHQMPVLGSAVPIYNNVGFNYGADTRCGPQGAGGPAARGFRGGPRGAGFQGGPRFGGPPGFMQPQFNGPPGYFGPPPGFFGPPGFFEPPGFQSPSGFPPGFRGRGGMFQGRPGYFGPRGFPRGERFPGPQPFQDPNSSHGGPLPGALLNAEQNKINIKIKRDKIIAAEKAAAGIFTVADYMSSATSGSESSSSARDRRSQATKSRSRSLQKSLDRKRKKSAMSSSDEEKSKSSKHRQKSRHSNVKSKKSSSKKSSRSKHSHSNLGSSDELEKGTIAHRHSKKIKKKRLLGNSTCSSSVSSDSSSDEYDARNPKTMIPKKQKDDGKWLPVAADAPPSDHTLPSVATPSSAPSARVGPPPSAADSTPNTNYKDIMTRIEQAISLSQVEEMKSQLAATEAAAAPAGGISRYSLKLTSGQNPLQQIWVHRLISYFQLQPGSVQRKDGSWLLRSNNSGVVAFLVKRLPSCRLLGARLNGTLHSAQDEPAAAAPDTDAVYSKIFEQFVSEYNDNLVTSLVLQVSTESDTSFFGANWQHVYTSGLTNIFLIAADAVRSLGRRLPRPGPPCPRILIVTPDFSTARCLAMILQPVLAAASSDMHFVKGDTRLDLSREVVLGTVHHLSEVEGQLQLRGLRAMIVDDAGFMVSSHLHSILMAQLVTRLRTSVGDFDAVNIVAVADSINVQELTKAETMLGCRFIRTDLKQHFALPTPTSQRHAAPPTVRYDHPSQASSYGEAAWPPPAAAATDARAPVHLGAAHAMRYPGDSPASGHSMATQEPCPSGSAPAPGYNASGPSQMPHNVPRGYPGNGTGEHSATPGYYGHNVAQHHSEPPAYHINKPPPTAVHASAQSSQQYSGPPGYVGGAPPQHFPQAVYQQPSGLPSGVYGNQAAHHQRAPTEYQITQASSQQQGMPVTEPIDQRQQPAVAEQGYYTRAGQPGDLQQKPQQSYAHYYNQ